jgi:alkylation response protein AidB-like acyl-CoA dehydrogenase
MWITNGGFADMFVVFAKVNGDQFAAFIVERGFSASAPARRSRRWGCTGRPA